MTGCADWQLTWKGVHLVTIVPVGYSKKNLRDVQDMAVEHGLSKTQEARFPGGDLGAEQTGMNYLIVKPGQREAFAHRHRTAEEIYVVLAGSGGVKLDDELVKLAPSRCRPGEPRRRASLRSRPRWSRGACVRSACPSGWRDGRRLLGRVVAHIAERPARTQGSLSGNTVASSLLPIVADLDKVSFGVAEVHARDGASGADPLHGPFLGRRRHRRLGARGLHRGNRR